MFTYADIYTAKDHISVVASRCGYYLYDKHNYKIVNNNPFNSVKDALDYAASTMCIDLIVRQVIV